MNELPPVLMVFLYALITALATGLGALPLLALRRVPERWMGIANGAAAGLMLAASFQLVREGLEYSMPRTVLGMLIGLAAIIVSQKLLSGDHEVSVAELDGASARKALLILGVMTAHCFAEGIGVGVSFGSTVAFGVVMSIAIAVHNVPEGLAISLAMVPRGVPVWRAAWWSVFSSLPQPLMAVPAFLFVSVFEPILPVGLGLAAGAMIWMAQSELVPDALEKAPKEQVATALTLAGIAMVAFQVVIGG
jgi:zinc transporter ZupT